MASATYGVVRAPAATIAEPAKPAAPRKSWFARFMAAMIESRMQQARREIAMHVHLLPYTFDERGNRLVKSDKDNMPLGG
jgi:hypothetical protein